MLFYLQRHLLNEKIPTDIKDILRIGKSRALPKIRKQTIRVEFTVQDLCAFSA